MLIGCVQPHRSRQHTNWRKAIVPVFVAMVPHQAHKVLELASARVTAARSAVGDSLTQLFILSFG